VARVFEPIARALLRLGLTPDAVTVLGTVAVVVVALTTYPRGWLFAGSLVLALFALFDTLDGTMARLSGTSSTWGAFLDSVLDRVSDAAIFSGLILWFVGTGDDVGTTLGLACLVLGQLVSYTRARAEGLGMTADVGFAERTERLAAVLLGAALVGLGLPVTVLHVVLGLLAVASVVTVCQRILHVRRQAKPSGDEVPR
jgi:CDP-diacylglycerol--glycerol-3-phosphate 3-phosphatidyltransferase